MTKKPKKTRKQQELAEIEFTSGDDGGVLFVDNKGMFADGQELLLHHDKVADAILHIAIATRSGRNKVERKTCDVPVGSTVTITYGVAEKQKTRGR